MGGVIGFASKQDCVMDLFFGTDYHSHLGTKRGGMCILQENGFNRSIHNIENSSVPEQVRTGYRGNERQHGDRSHQ